MKKLVIAEKPSVARDLARVLGKIPKKEDIVVIYGRLGEDIIFIEKMYSLKDKIYMKLSEIK